MSRRSALAPVLCVIVLACCSRKMGAPEPLYETTTVEVRDAETAPPRPAASSVASPRTDVAPPTGGGSAVVAGAVADVPHLATPIAPVTPPDGVVDYGINGFVQAALDPLSTFAIDVDTASYTMARRSLTDGYLPATAAVRVEEFVNYFPYEYDRPDEGAPFGVDVEAAPSPFDERRTVVRIGVQGKKVPDDARKPAHLTFLVDTSGSMRSPDKIELVKEALTMLTEELEDGDTVAIATYAGGTKVVLEPTPISRKEDIVRSLRQLSAQGSTAMASGIQLAYGLADRSFVPGTVNRVIICSDGDANVGTTHHGTISEGIRAYAEKGITLTTLGFGNGNYKDVMMERLANDGDGNYYYVDSEREARRVLVDKLTGTLEVIAKDVKIQVEWDPASVTEYRLLGYENRDVADRDFRNDAVDAGEIGAGHQVTALYEVVLADGARGPLGTVRIRNQAPGPDAPHTERTWTLERSLVAVSAGYFAEILRGSPHLPEISLRQVERLARDAQRAEYVEDAELVELIGRAAELRGERPIAMR